MGISPQPGGRLHGCGQKDGHSARRAHPDAGTRCLRRWCDKFIATGPGCIVPPRADRGDSTAATDLSAIACATDDPDDVGDLTGAWRGSEGGVYYIRQVGDCVWWFGTEVEDIEPGLIGQPGFANVASGRIVGTQIDVEWADLPLGDILGGGGLTFVYDEERNQLVMTEQRGDWQPFGGSTLTRIEPSDSPDASPSESASP